jgi:hypothetical protein
VAVPRDQPVAYARLVLRNPGLGTAAASGFNVCMIHPELLQILRCPLDPQRQTSLVEEDRYLVCPRCQLKYPIKDGFPVLVIEEAELPPGCSNVEELAGKHAAPAGVQQGPQAR